jgi:ribokinase|tara:strand:- start:98 stop:1018 length:921 start_codon:yes stop_codon:yes gene_type:complete
MSNKDIVILGVFVADTAYRASRQPKIGETIIGNEFSLGPGGKGSNQAVAAALAGGNVHFISRLGKDDFANMAISLWEKSGITPHVTQYSDSYTGAAYIFIEDKTGNNAIIVSPGAAANINDDDITANKELIQGSRVFMTQLEQSLDAAGTALSFAKDGGAITILNPAPAQPLGENILKLCDFVTPNEIEAEQITGTPVKSINDAEIAAGKLLEKGASAAVITLGEQGALFKDNNQIIHQPSYEVGPVVETTGAGDAFNGGLAVALAEEMPIDKALRFACATASISVTRQGTAPSMPDRHEIDTLIK